MFKNSSKNHYSTYIKTFSTFVKSIKTNPKSIGMLFPSSSFLSKKLARQIPEDVIAKIHQQVQGNTQNEKQVYIIELGAGTGSVTKEILSKGVPQSRLLVFENSSEMASILKAKFPTLQIIQDDAANMEKYIPQNADIAVIVSSLPFLSLPLNVSESIITVITKLLKNSLFIQYTYSFKAKSFLEEKGFRVKRKETVFLNLPPAQVINYSYY